MKFLCLTDPTAGEPPSPTYVVTCRARLRQRRWLFEAWYHPLRVGQLLPMMPLWLGEDQVASLDLEASYEETCRVLRIR